VAKVLLTHIPRMEAIAWMISQQLSKDPSENSSEMHWQDAESIVLGARILKLAVAFDNYKMSGLTDEEALGRFASGGMNSERNW